MPHEAFAAAGVEPRGELWAAMLDTKAGWDDLVRRHAPDAKVRDAILANPLYQNITGRFVQSHDYIAMERLYELHASGRYDLIIVDTPPTRNAIDFLEAPERMADFFEPPAALAHRAVPRRGCSRRRRSPSTRWPTASSARSSCRTSPSSSSCSRRCSGLRRAGQRRRAARSPTGARRSSWCPRSRPRPTHEATYLARALRSRDMHLGAIVANRVLPAGITPKASATSARRLPKLDKAPSCDGASRSRSTSRRRRVETLARRRRAVPRHGDGRHP